MQCCCLCCCYLLLFGGDRIYLGEAELLLRVLGHCCATLCTAAAAVAAACIAVATAAAFRAALGAAVAFDAAASAAAAPPRHPPSASPPSHPAVLRFPLLALTATKGSTTWEHALRTNNNNQNATRFPKAHEYSCYSAKNSAQLASNHHRQPATAFATSALGVFVGLLRAFHELNHRPLACSGTRKLKHRLGS